MEPQVFNADVRTFNWEQWYGLFRHIYIDPPWFYNDQKLVRKDGAQPTRGIGACHHYHQLREEPLADLPIGEIAHPDSCLLHMWATCPLLPQAIRLIEIWGYTYATVEYAWIKTNPRQWAQAQQQVTMITDLPEFLDHLTFYGPGYYTGSNIELLLVAWKGAHSIRHLPGVKHAQVVYAPGAPRRHYCYRRRKPNQVVFAPRGAHSAKPIQVQENIGTMYPEGPYLEVFSRSARQGWSAIGNEV